MGWNKGGYLGFDEGWNISSASNPVVTSVGSGTASGSGTAVFTYTAAGVGAASSTRRVIVTGGLGTAGLTISSVTIGGNATTLAQSGTGESSTGGSLVWVASAVVSTGTTADVVVTYSGNNFIAQPIRVWTVNDSLLISPTPTGGVNHVNSNSATVSLSTAAGGFSLLSCISFGAGTTWGFTSSDDTFTEVSRDNGNGRLWGYVNGTQTRTATTVLSSSATTNLHAAIWNFR